MRRIALIFTVLVFTLLLAGWLSRHGGSEPIAPRFFEPGSTPSLPPVVDPLGLAPGARAAADNRLSVRLVDPDGAAVSGAALVVRSGNAAVWAFSAADGTATLEGLSPGVSRLAVIAFPHPNLELDIEPGAQVREIKLEAKAGVPAGLPDIPRSAFSGQLLPGGTFTGFEVLLLPMTSPSQLGGALPRRSLCDDAGRFSFEGLAHGRYQLAVLPAWAGGGSWPDLSAKKSRTLDFNAELTQASIEIERCEIEGEVRDDLGRALEGALVLVNEVANESRVWPPSSSGPDGRFRIQDLPPGAYRVSCRAGEGGSAIERLEVAPGAPAWAALPRFAARKRP